MIIKPYSAEQARMLSPLQLAFIGDSVHAMLVRQHLLAKNMNVKQMHLKCVQAVRAVSQAKSMDAILPLLSDEELSIVKRGRNAHAHHGSPKGASVSEYASATGLEALLGFLYLIDDMERIDFLLPYLMPED